MSTHIIFTEYKVYIMYYVHSVHYWLGGATSLDNETVKKALEKDGQKHFMDFGSKGAIDKKVIGSFVVDKNSDVDKVLQLYNKIREKLVKEYPATSKRSQPFLVNSVGQPWGSKLKKHKFNQIPSFFFLLPSFYLPSVYLPFTY